MFDFDAPNNYIALYLELRKQGTQHAQAMNEAQEAVDAAKKTK